MMKKRKNGWMRKGMIAMVSALTIAASAGTVLAYEPLQSSDVSVNDSLQDGDIDYLTYNVADAPLVDSFDFSVSDKIFISLDGKQEPIFDSSSERALCRHNMVDGYMSTHASKSNGGCVVKVYTCQRCTRCGYLANAVYQNTVTYAKCPHK